MASCYEVEGPRLLNRESRGLQSFLHIHGWSVLSFELSGFYKLWTDQAPDVSRGSEGKEKLSATLHIAVSCSMCR
jgi:hypothetical protein